MCWQHHSGACPHHLQLIHIDIQQSHAVRWYLSFGGSVCLHFLVVWVHVIVTKLRRHTVSSGFTITIQLVVSNCNTRAFALESVVMMLNVMVWCVVFAIAPKRKPHTLPISMTMRVRKILFILYTPLGATDLLLEKQRKWVLTKRLKPILWDNPICQFLVHSQVCLSDLFSGNYNFIRH